MSFVGLHPAHTPVVALPALGESPTYKPPWQTKLQYLKRLVAVIVYGAAPVGGILVCQGQRVFHYEILLVRLDVSLTAIIILQVVDACSGKLPEVIVGTYST